jgi:hypothetical protein
MLAPAGLTATRYVSAVALVLHTVNVLTTVLVKAGTVYSVVNVVALGADCPKTLYAVAMYYAPMNKKMSCRPAVPPPPDPALPV